MKLHAQDGYIGPGRQRREAIVAFLQANPGASFRQVAAGTGIPAGCARHHLNYLERQNRIWVTQDHGYASRLRHFAGPKPSPVAAVKAVRSSLTRNQMAVLQSVLAAPRCNQAHIIKSVPLGRSSIQYALHRLERMGMIRVEYHGRNHSYQAKAVVI